MSDLDKDFENLAKQINIKLKEAAEALKEAGKLATKAGLPSLIDGQYLWEDLKWKNRSSKNPKTTEELEADLEGLRKKLGQIDVSGIEDAMSDCGWSASSSYC